MSWLNPGVWLAGLLLALAGFGGGYLQGHSAGTKACQVDWAAERSVTTHLQLVDSESNRAREQALSAQVIKAQNNARMYEQGKKDAVAAANRLSSSLHDTVAKLNSRISAASQASLREYTTALSAVFDDCQAKYREMAEAADGHSGDVRMLEEAWPRLPVPAPDSGWTGK